MPQSAQDNRNHIGNYQHKISNYNQEIKTQREIISYLANHPGDPNKRARAELMLQSLLFISNYAGNISHFQTLNKKESAALQAHAPNHADGVNTSLNGNPLPFVTHPLAPPASSSSNAIMSLSKQGVEKGILTADVIVKNEKPVSLVVKTARRTRSLPLSSAEPDDVVSTQARRVGRWLVANNAVAAPVVSRENHALLNECIDFIRQYPEKLPVLVQELCKTTGEYGSHQHEPLTEHSQNLIFNRWLEAMVFETSLGEFIAKTMTNAEYFHSAEKDEKDATRSIAKIYTSILKKLGIIGMHSKDDASLGEHVRLNEGAQKYLLENIVKPIMPTLRYYNELTPFAGMEVGSVEWVHLHVGLKFINGLQIDDADFSQDELLQIGNSLEAMLSMAMIEPDIAIYFDMPAKLFYCLRLTQNNMPLDIHNVFNGANATSIALDHFFDASDKYNNEKNPFAVLSKALGEYKKRSQFPGEPEQTREQFVQQNENIADSYVVVDNLLLWQRLIDAAPEEIEFISASKVSGITAYFSAFDAIRNQMSARYLPRDSYTVNLLPEVNLLAAERGQEKRLYALRPSNNGYDFQRVDENEYHYYELMTDPITCRKDPDYKLNIISDTHNSPVFKSEPDTLNTLVDNVVQLHRTTLLENLHNFGFELTAWEKTQRILLSLVPLYDCITGIQEGSHAAAIPCATDVLSFAPFIGKGAGLAAKAAQRGTMAGIVSLRAAAGSLTLRSVVKGIASRGGVNLFRYAVVPASQVLDRKAMVALGVSAIRAVDPGFELLAFVGVRGARRLTDVAAIMGGRVPVWKKLKSVLERRDLTPFTIPTDVNYLTGRLPGIDKDITIIRLGGDKHVGRDIYVRINPDTGDIYGRKYTRSAEGILETVPNPVAKRLHTILEQGLSGRGAPGAARGLADARSEPPYMRVTGAHLAEWVENSINPSPQTMGEFIGRRYITFANWRHYVHVEGTLTSQGQALLQNHDPATWNRIFDLPPEIQHRILGHGEARMVNALGEAYPAVRQNQQLRASFQEHAVRQLALLRTHFFDQWDTWARNSVMGGGKHQLAVSKLKSCLTNNDMILDLTGFDLPDLPEIIPPGIVKLILNHNKLSHLPDHFPPGLMHLEVNHNLLINIPVNLPDSVGVIKASYNNIIHLAIPSTSTVQELDVSFNQIATVPRQLPPTLSFLMLNNNRLTELPDLSRLNLKTLDVGYNRITALPLLPDSIKILNVKSNQLRVLNHPLPVNLNYLDLSSNSLADFPPVLGDKIKHLKIDANMLMNIPFALPPKLRDLSAANNLIQQFPATWPYELTSLTLGDNFILSVGETTFPPTLKYLNLEKNYIELLPETLPDSLESIYIGNNKLDALPQKIPACLKLIDVSNNRIIDLPAHLSPEIDFINTQSLPEQ